MSDHDASNHLETKDTLARLGGDRELLGELYAAFAEDAPGKLKDLETALQAGDMDLVMKRAHSLKGSAAAVGANECRSLAMQLEAKAEGRDQPVVGSLLQQLKAEMDRVLALIRQQL